MVALTESLSNAKLTGTTVITAIAFSGIIYWLHQWRKSVNKIPSKWRAVGKVHNLYIYPLKSGHAIDVNKADCTPLGFREVQEKLSPEGSEEEFDRFLLQDRFFMIYQQPSKKFLTARQKHITLLIKMRSPGPNAVTLSMPNCDEVTFQVANNRDQLVKCTMHSNEEIDVVDCGDHVAAWLSKIIFGKESGLRLGYYPDANKRLRTMTTSVFRNNPIIQKYMRDSDFGAYSDVASYMLLSQNSVEDLKSRLNPDAGDVTVRHFRPNIVVSGPDVSAYDEDNWRWIKIGEEVVMKGFKPCTRCAMVTLDPDKGVANPVKEPLVTLKKYRKVTDEELKPFEGDSPVFGRYFGLHHSGRVSVGDTIYVPA